MQCARPRRGPLRAEGIVLTLLGQALPLSGGMQLAMAAIRIPITTGRRPSGGSAMRSILYVMLFAAATASAQNMYKCSNAGKVEYSDKPCSQGDLVKQIAPDGGPTREDRARAHMRSNAERARVDAQDRTEASNRANRAEAADAGRAQADLDASAAGAAKQAAETSPRGAATAGTGRRERN